MADGFAVDRAALAETAKGLTGVVDQLKSIGVSEDAEVGLGFTDLALSGAQAGMTIAASLSKFCDKWQWGVAALVEDGYQFGERLGLTAGLYGDAEHQSTGAFKQLLAAVAGDPNMSAQQAASASWKQDAAEITQAQTPGSQTTLSQAAQDAPKQWAPTGHAAESDINLMMAPARLVDPQAGKNLGNGK